MSEDKYSFVYLDVNHHEMHDARRKNLRICNEIVYSISTLLAEFKSRSTITIYTNSPGLYKTLPVTIENIEDVQPAPFGEPFYFFRAKPCVLLDALRKCGNAAIFLDSDTYIRPGFASALRTRFGDVALIDRIEGFSAPLDFTHLTGLPHKGRHVPAPGQPFSANSGVIGVRPGWGEAMLEDAIALIDKALASGATARTLEQAAISESIRLHGIPVMETYPWAVHYCTPSQKRYMHFRIGRVIRHTKGSLEPSRPLIEMTPARVKLYQYYWDMKTLGGRLA